MNICSTCRHWNNIDDFIEDITRYGRENDIPQLSKECTAIGNERDLDNQKVAWICESEVFLISERSTGPFLLTAPDFYCGLWQGKDVS